MRAKKLRILVLVLIATMLFGLVACGNNTTPANGDPISGTQRLVVAMPENVVGFDPGNSKGNADNIVAMVQYEALVETDHTGNYSPCLAKEWESSEDGTEWTFYLRDDVTFSNGSKFDSNDVVVPIRDKLTIGPWVALQHSGLNSPLLKPSMSIPLKFLPIVPWLHSF